jgi:hypothetical protein
MFKKAFLCFTLLQPTVASSNSYNCTLVDFLKVDNTSIFGVEPEIGSTHIVNILDSKIILELTLNQRNTKYQVELIHVIDPTQIISADISKNGYYLAMDDFFGLVSLNISENNNNSAAAVLSYSFVTSRSPLSESWLFTCSGNVQ